MTILIGNLLGNGGAADEVPPVLTVISPTPGVAAGAPGGFPADPTAAANTPIILRVTDVDPGNRYIVIIATLANGHEEVVYRRGAFRGGYVASIETAITYGVELTVSRAGGWPFNPSPSLGGTIVFVLDALDQAGNLAA